ncbi:Glycine--tRNA ligase [Chionoecetes opilio]|uniref:Glycine--tRNA ligase n=1 Tax=Chionoecetes opilio TaxID=41210 RepID=A0A8J5CGB9_CHIOP|nr:Glycine--tRNA ligase [Chionoecetes opilio]
MTSQEKEALALTLARLEGMTMEEMNALMRKHDMKSPLTGNDLTDATEFNLMFPITIGPSGHLKGFLRPETAQGIFVNFKRLLEYNQGKLPFACAQVRAQSLQWRRLFYRHSLTCFFLLSGSLISCLLLFYLVIAFSFFPHPFSGHPKTVDCSFCFFHIPISKQILPHYSLLLL